MATCPSCASDVSEGNRFCGSCGAAIETPTSAPTETSLESRPTATSHSSLGKTRFIPGTMLAKRYRIVGLLGRGGMGEVYRADDLKLGQPVALKFLPQAMQRDRARLDRFLNEVRTALKVTHANVCRVYDIGEVDGQHYLSMEYVDGEDLASLLRRIGHLPQDKAVQIARQLCVGLAAAHEEGILHRDLKPANVMIDGRGRAKITDFGLAGLAEGIEGDEARAGTPQYMSPEQHAGKEVTVRSDIYSLGLVLYEMFTGKRALEAASPAGIKKLQQESTPTSPGSLVDGLHDSVERAILRCLDRDPTQRPPSALAVSASLPGGDPLAAALAAGETPSPEMVAAAGGTKGLRPAVAIVLLAVVLVGIPGTALMSPGYRLDGIAPPAKPPEVLRAEARSIIENLGYQDPPADSAFGFEGDRDLLDHIESTDDSPDRWERLATLRPAPIRFWYRQSPRPLVPLGWEPAVEDQNFGVSPHNPPPEVSGMVAVRLDGNGDLVEFQAIPPEISEPTTRSSRPDWGPLLSSAGLDGAKLTPVGPKWNPLVDCDVREAWDTVYPGQPDLPIRVEAGAWQGKPVFFRIVTPWTRASRMVEHEVGTKQARLMFLFFLFLVILGAAALLARRNLRLGRGDRRGALRLAGFVFLLVLLQWVALAHHVAAASEVMLFAFGAIPKALFLGGSSWLVYVALEPYVRRLWPQMLISWSRLLDGRFRDPLVGRDILVGGATGVAANAVIEFFAGLNSWLTHPTPVAPEIPVLVGFSGLRQLVGVMMTEVPVSVFITVALLFLIVLLLLILRKRWLAMGAFIVIQTPVVVPQFDTPFVGVVAAVVFFGLYLFVLVRFGLLASVFQVLMINLPQSLAPPPNASAWFAGRWAFLIGVMMGLAVYGFVVSLGGRRILRDTLLEEPPRAA